ncbi:hypothetical protein Tco_1531886 [Tanacetum coccineum]
MITSLKNDLRKIKGKEIVHIVAQIPSANTIVLGMFKLDLEPLAPRLFQNREAHIDYLKYTQEQADILWEIVEQAKAEQPLDKELDFACCFHTQNKDKKVSFAEPLTSSSNSKQVESSKTSDSNTHLLSSTGLKCSTSKCGSKPTGNKRNDRISQTSSRNMKVIVDIDAQIPSVSTIVPGMFKLDLEPLAPSAKKVVVTPKNKVKKVRIEGSSKTAKIVESKNDNHSEPNNTWGSNATDIPSSSSLVMIGCPDFSLEKAAILSINQSSRHNQEKLYLLHMDLCGPMHVASINGKRFKEAVLVFSFAYALARKEAIRIYNKRTQKIIKTIHVTFDELTAMASKQFSLGLGLKCMTPATSSLGLVLNPVSQQPCIPPKRDDWDYLFQPMFDEYFTSLAIAIPLV